MNLFSGLLLGAAAGAAGTTALNAVTYLDMSVRGRPTSETPEKTVETVADKLHVDIPGEGDQKQNRIAGLGPLTGIAAGVGIGAVFGLLRAAGWRPPLLVATLTVGFGAMAASDGGMIALGVTDPRTWAAKDWAADIVPHVAYGAVTAGLLQAYDG